MLIVPVIDPSNWTNKSLIKKVKKKKLINKYSPLIIIKLKLLFN